MSFTRLLKKIFQKASFYRRPPKEFFEKNHPWVKMYDKGVSETIDIPNKTMVDYLSQAIQESGDKTFINYFSRKISYAEFNSCVKKCAVGLQVQGIGKGDRVALILPNMPQFLIAYWAALSIGAIVVLVNPVLTAREIKEQIEIVDPKMIVILDRLLGPFLKEFGDGSSKTIIAASVESFFPTVKRLAFHISKPSTWPSIGQNAPSNALLFRELLNSNTNPVLTHIQQSDPAVLLFTGGVTGSPKAAVLTHRNLVANVLQATTWMKSILCENEVFLGTLPFIHSYGMSACHHLVLVVQGTLILEPRFNVRKVIKDVRNLKVTIFPGVPTMFQAFMDKYEGDPKTSLKFCISGGAPLPSTLQTAFNHKFSQPIVQGYGLSEASPITHCNPINGENKPGSIGLPWPGTDAKIVHTKTGQTRPAYKKGELWVKGPQVMKEYWQNPKETKKILKDGWLATGDIAYYDENGYFYIVDRKKQLIFSGGSNIYPSEVETVLLEHPLIDEAAVVGAQDNFLGEVVKAVIVTNENRDVSLEELSLFCEDKLAKYKIPRQLEKRQQLPKNFLGKVVKRNL